MAEMRDSRKKDPQVRENEPRLSRSPNNGMENGGPETEGAWSGGSGKKKKESWIKKNPDVAKGIAAGALLVVLVLVIGWWLNWFGGGGSSKPAPVASAPSPPEASQPAAPLAQAPQSPPANPPGQPPTQPGQNPAGTDPNQAATAKQEPPPLPEDVTKWKGEDFRLARKLNDPRLVQAITYFYLGDKFRGKEEAAKGLIELLQPRPPEPKSTDKTPATGSVSPNPSASTPPGPPRGQYPGSPGQPPYMPSGYPASGPGDVTKLIEVLVEALGNNGTELARNALEQILAGTFSTEDDKTAVEAAVKTLATHCAENEALLLRVLTATEELRPADRQGAWPAKDLRAKAFEFIKPTATSELRLKLAKYMVGRPGKIDPKDPIFEYLLAPSPVNCSAQLAIYEKALLPKESKDLRTQLEQQILSYSSTALASLLGVSTESVPGSGSPYMPMMQPGSSGGGFVSPPQMRPPQAGPSPYPMTPSSPAEGQPAKPVDLSLQMANQLWSEAFLSKLEPQLGEVRSLEKQGPLVLLASTIPQDTTRTILAKLLRERAKEGPKALETAGMFDRMITDPGLLVLVKLLPRKDYKSSTKNPTGATPRPPRTGNGPSGSGSSTEAAQKKQQTEQEWLDASKKLVYAWCARFNAAATAKEAASTESDEPAASTPNNTAAPKLPEDFALGADAKVTAEYHLVWPEKAPPQCAELKLGWLEIHYVRAEESGKLKTIKGFYKNKAKVKPADVRTTDKGLWIENTKKDTQNDRRRSLDVLISRSDGKTTIAPVGSNAKEEDVETDYIIEVLSVEIKEP